MGSNDDKAPDVSPSQLCDGNREPIEVDTTKERNRILKSSNLCVWPCNLVTINHRDINGDGIEEVLKVALEIVSTTANLNFKKGIQKVANVVLS